MRLLKSLVIRNIQHAKTRRSEVLENDISNGRYWDGYISALESIVHVLPDEDGEQSEEILQTRQSPASSDNPTSS